MSGLFDAVAGVGGAIMSLVMGLLQVIVVFICDLIIGIIGTAASFLMQAMTTTPDQIESWLGTALTTGSWRAMITGVSFAIAMLFMVWELLKGLFAHISGENPPSRPYVIAIRALIFGAWTIAGIPTTRILFNVGSRIYNAAPFGSFSMNFMDVLGNMFSNLLTGIGGWVGSTITGGGGVSHIGANLIARIVVCALILFSIINFIKLLSICMQRFVSMVFYTYLSPLAICCGVSPSWSKITWNWVKTTLSTLVIWIIDDWCIFGSMQLLQTCTTVASGPDLNAALSCLFATYGFITVSQNLDGIMSQFGASVTKTSGSLMRDLRDMVIAGRAVTGIAGPAVKTATSVGGAAIGAAGAALAGGAGGLAAMGAGIKGAFAATSFGQFASMISGGITSASGFVNGLRTAAATGRQSKTAVAAGKQLLGLSGNTSPEAARAREGILRDAQAKGVGLNDITQNPAFRDHVAGHTLFDPSDPSKGTMKDNGYEVSDLRFGEHGGRDAMFQRKDANGNVMSQIEAKNIGADGAVPAPPSSGVSRGVQGTLSGMGVAGMTGGQPGAAGASPFHRAQNQAVTSLSDASTPMNATASFKGLDGSSSMISAADTGRTDESGRHEFALTGYNSDGTAAWKQTAYAKKNSNAMDVAKDVASLGASPDLAKASTIATQTAEKGEPPKVLAGERQAVGEFASLAGRIPSTPAVDAGGKPITVGGASFGADAKSQYAVSRVTLPNGNSQLTLADRQTGHVAKTIQAPTKDVDAAIRDGSAGVEQLLGNAPAVGATMGANAAYKSVYDAQSVGSVNAVSREKGTAQVAYTGGVNSAFAQPGQEQAATVSHSGNAAAMQFSNGNIALRRADNSLNNTETASSFSEVSGFKAGAKDEVGMMSMQTPNGNMGAYTASRNEDGSQTVLTSVGGRNFADKISGDMDAGAYARGVIDSSGSLGEGATRINANLAGGMNGVLQAKEQGVISGEAVELKMPEGCSAPAQAVFNVSSEAPETPIVVSGGTAAPAQPAAGVDTSAPAPSPSPAADNSQPSPRPSDGGRQDSGRGDTSTLRHGGEEFQEIVDDQPYEPHDAHGPEDQQGSQGPETRKNDKNAKKHGRRR